MDKDDQKKITTVFFDIGGVIVSSFGKGFIDYASKTLGIEEESLRQIINETEAPLQRGEIEAHPNKQHIEFWYNVMDKAREKGIATKKEIPERRELAQLWVKPYLDNVRVNDEMVQLLRDLKETGDVRLFTLSNIQEPHTLILKKLLGKDFEELFDGHILSNEVHARKPDPEVYQIALEKAGCKPEDALFIDDSRINLEGAEKEGMNIFLQKEGDVKSTKVALREFGVRWTDTGPETTTEINLPIS